MSNNDLSFSVTVKTDQLQDSLAQMNSAIEASMSRLAGQVEQASQATQSSMQKMAESIGDASKAADNRVASDATAILGRLPGVQQNVDSEMLASLTQYTSNTQIVFAKNTAGIEQTEKTSMDRRRQQWGQFFQGINSAFSTFTKSLLSGHQTLGQAWTKMVDSMAAAYISSLERQLMAFLQNKLKEVAIHAQAEATKDAASEATHAKEGTRTAYSAAQHAYDAVVDTPIIGPVLAPLAAAGAFAAVAALGSAEGGQWEVPGVQMTMLHPREMVLPAGLAQGVRDMVEGGGAGRNAVYAPTLAISAVDGESVARIYNTHIKPMMQRDIAKFLSTRGLVTA